MKLSSNPLILFLEHKKAFDKHRKEHYNEAQNIKLARVLIAKELAELEDDGEPVATTFAESASPSSQEQQVSLERCGLTQSNQ